MSNFNHQREKMEKRLVVLVPSPLQGHINPMLELGTALHSKGFAITIIHTEFNSPNPSTHPEFTFVPISYNLTNSDKTSQDLRALFETVNTRCEAPMKECLATIMDQQGLRDRLVCVINDAVMHVGERVAKHFNLPSIMLHTCAALNVYAYFLLPQLQKEGYFPLKDFMLQDLVPGLDPLRFKDLPLFNVGPSELPKELIDIACNIGTSSAIIWNTMEEFEHPILEKLREQYKVDIFPIGPLCKVSPFSSSGSMIDEDTNCIKWLDKQACCSVLYVSLGSIVHVTEKELSEMAWGLANSRQPFLWVIRSGFVSGSTEVKLPEGFEDEIRGHGCIVKWAPQKKVLAHKATGGFWSHCGWNSTLESIGEGIPMICSPSFGDQKVNSRYISNVWKVGLELGTELERSKIERAVRRLTVDTEGEELRKRAYQLKEKLNCCVREGGSSYNSLNNLAQYISSL